MRPKRITLTCKKCGKEWLEKPNHSWRKYCSTQCAGNSIRINDKEKVCVQCGKTFQTTWKTRSNISCSRECAYLYHGIQQREKGHSPILFRDESKWLAAVQSEKNRIRTRELHLGKIRNTPQSKRYSPNHIRARECFLRDPSGVIHYVKNITRFVHMNPDLFPPETLNWRPGKKYKSSISCAATYGLVSIVNGHRMTWRGWQLIGNREGRERFDLIARNFTTNENP